MLSIWSRLGIGLHGISAVGAPLWPVSSFKTYIAAVRQVKGDQTVGYGRKGVLGRDTRIAVIPVGYADGLDRHLSCGVGEVWIGGQKSSHCREYLHGCLYGGYHRYGRTGRG